MAPLPKGGPGGKHTGTLGGWQLAVNKYAEEHQGGDRTRGLSHRGEEQKRAAITASLNPTIPALYKDPDVLTASPFFGELLETFTNAVARPSRVTGDRYNKVSSAFWNAVHDTLSGRPLPRRLARLESSLKRLSRAGSGRAVMAPARRALVHPPSPGARPAESSAAGVAPSLLTRQRRRAAWLFVLPMLLGARAGGGLAAAAHDLLLVHRREPLEPRGAPVRRARQLRGHWAGTTTGGGLSWNTLLVRSDLRDARDAARAGHRATPEHALARPGTRFARRC